MPKFRQLSGLEVIKFEIHSQRGSHVKMRRITEFGKQTLTIPNHKRIDTGTCRAIVKQASQYIPLTELARHFYV